MALFGFFGFLVYMVLFITGQSIVGRRYGAHNNSGTRDESIVGMLFMMVFAGAWPFSCVLLKGGKAQPVALGIGLSLVVVGLLLSMWSQAALGSNWVGGVGIHKQHRLITTEPYRFVRHPMYTGMLLSTIGFAVACLNIWYGLAILCFAARFLLRAPMEERALQVKFHKQYPAYAARTGMLFPRIRK